MDKSDIKRLEALKRDKADNERALSHAIFAGEADRLQWAIRSQEAAIESLEARLRAS